MGVSTEKLDELAQSQWFRLFKKEEGIEGEQYFFTGSTIEEAQIKFEAAMAEVAAKHPDIELKQLQSANRESLLTYMVRSIRQPDGSTNYSVYWGFTPNGALAFAEPNLTNDLTRLGEVSVPAGLRPEFNYNEADGHWYMFGVDQDGKATQWFNTFGATQASLDQHWTEIDPVIPELPEWATEYTAHHGGIYEKDGDQQYYACDKQITVGEEVRSIRVRLVEYDDEAKEWIPCYETIQNLLDSDKYGSLLTLNTITTPADAVWMIRKGGVQEVSDLQRLEVILNAFAARIETEHTPPENVAATLPLAEISDYTQEELLTVMPPTNLAQFEIQSYNYKGEERFAKPIVVDGIDIINPHSWVTLRRGGLDSDQFVTGALVSALPGVVWVGFDKSVLEDVIQFYPAITSFDEIMANFAGVGKEVWRAAFVFVKDISGNFGENYPGDLSAWQDVVDYFNSLPAGEKDYVQKCIALYEKGEKGLAISSLSGKILWRISGSVKYLE